MNSAYHQLELEESSRVMTTFSTHLGLRRYKRLIFGVNCASEIFQDTLSNALQGLRGVKNIWDDIIIFGKSKQEHDENLKEALDRFRNLGLTLNWSKCKFNETSISFFGHVFSSEGVKADPEKSESNNRFYTPSKRKRS